MSGDLTGRTRHRPLRVPWSRSVVLVLQVEVKNFDHDYSPSLTLWRDAMVEDLANLPDLYKEKTT